MISEYYTAITATGSEEELATFKRICLPDDHFEFRRVLPAMGVRGLLDTLGEIGIEEISDHDVYDVLKEAAVIIDCFTQAWGCPLDRYEAQIAEEEPEKLVFYFFTHGGLPEKVFEAMAKKFPKLTFDVYTERRDDNGPQPPRTIWLLQDGKVISVRRSADMDAEILKRIRPGMSEEEKGRLADWCAGEDQVNLLTAEEWFDEVRRVIRESARRSAEKQEAA